MATLTYFFWEPWTINLRNGSIWLNLCLIWSFKGFRCCHFLLINQLWPIMSTLQDMPFLGWKLIFSSKQQPRNILDHQIRHEFNQIDPFLKFIVQGSQKKYVRVAISQKFDEVFFQFPARIIAKIVVENATVVAFLEDFVCIFTLTIWSVFSLLRVKHVELFLLWDLEITAHFRFRGVQKLPGNVEFDLPS